MRGLYIFITLLSLPFAFSSCDDYIERGIEGRWQLREVTQSDGTVSKVDTVFYSFKKDVFEYLKLITPTERFHCFGNYKETGDQLKISVVESSFEPDNCESCFDWESMERTFTVKERTSSKLVLDSDGVLYNFRKY